MATVANGLRAEHSPSYIVEQLLTQAKKQPRNTIIESIRTPGEVAALRTLGGSTFCLLSVDADAKLRYSRVVERKSATDQVSFEKFLADEQREMNNKEPHQQNLTEVIRQADYKLTNDSDLDSFHAQIAAVVERMMPSAES